MVSALPLELVLVVFAALLSRTLNKYPPFWERFVGGLKYFAAPVERDVATYIKSATKAAREYAAGGELLENAAQRAERLVGDREKPIPYSYYPVATFRWNDVLLTRAANSIAATAAYIALAIVCGGILELITGRTNSYLDFALIAAVCMVVFAPFQFIAATFMRHMWATDVWVTWGVAVLAFISSVVLLHAPPAYLRLYLGVPLVQALGDLALVAPLAPTLAAAGAAAVAASVNATDAGAAAMDASAAAAGAAEFSGGAAPALSASYLLATGPGSLPPNNALVPFTTGLSIVVAVIAAALYTPLFRIVRLHRDWQRAHVSLPEGQRDGLLRTLLLHASYVTPLLVWILLTGPLLGDGIGLGLVPAAAVPCCDPSEPAYTCASVMRDCLLSDSSAAGAGAPVTTLSRIPFGLALLSEAPFVTFTMPESAWLVVRVLAVLALALLQLLQVRRWLQQHLLSGKAEQVGELVTGVVAAVKQVAAREAEAAAAPGRAGAAASSADGSGTIRGAVQLCSDGKEYPAGSVYDGGHASLIVTDMPLSQQAVQLVQQRCQVQECVASFRVGIVATELLVTPVLLALLSLLLLRRSQVVPLLAQGLGSLLSLVAPALGQLVSSRFGAIAVGSAAGVVAEAEGKGPSFAGIFSAGGLFDPAHTPWARALQPAYAQLLLLYITNAVAAVSVVLLVVLSLVANHVSPAMRATRITKVAAQERGAATQAAATAPAAGAAGGKADNKKRR